MTNSYMVICCSTADLPTSHPTERGVPYPCLHFRTNGMEYDDGLGEPISTENLYENIRQEAMFVAFQVDPKQYEVMFEPILKEGKGIIYMTPSSGISGTYNSAVIAKDEMLERYPDRRTTVVDSYCASAGYGLLVDTIWEKMQVDADYEELVS